MLGLLAMLLLAAEPVEAMLPDGGPVPTIAPKLTPRFAPILAPELVPDAGVIITPDPTLSVYDVDLPVETAITTASAALFLVVEFMVKPTLEGDISCRRPVGNGRCFPEDLTPLDRYAVGKRSPEWEAFGDVTLAVSMLAPAVYLGLESVALPTAAPWTDFGGDALVVGEAMALTGAMQIIMKFAFRRPRPVRYEDVEIPLSTFDQELSFPSGHVSLVAASTTALTTTVFLRHPKSPVRFAVLGAGLLLTGLTAVSRVESGQHFPTDAIIGTMIGAFAGFTVPYLHRKELPVTPTASFNPVTGQPSFGITGTF